MVLGQLDHLVLDRVLLVVFFVLDGLLLLMILLHQVNMYSRKIHEHLACVLLVFGWHLDLVEHAAARLVDHHVFLGRARTALVQHVRRGHLLDMHRLRVLRVVGDVLHESLARELVRKTVIVLLLSPIGRKANLHGLLSSTEALLRHAHLALSARCRVLGLLLR